MAKVGIPIMKLNSKHSGGQTKRKGNQTKALAEGLEERWSSDEDLDRSLTKNNIYFDENGNVVPPISGVELSKQFDEEAANYKESYTIRNGKHAGKVCQRGIKSDAVTGFALIIKPEGEFIDSLTPEQQVQYFYDSYDIVNDIMGINEKTGRNNIRAAVLQVDEQRLHMHCYGMPYTKDGRLCADDVFKLSLYNRFNREYPKRMRERGWQIDDCVSYDIDKVKKLEEAADELERQGKTDEAAAKREEISDYKQEHIEMKKKSKSGGKPKKQYVIDKLEEKTETLTNKYNDLFLLEHNKQCQITKLSDEVDEKKQELRDTNQEIDEKRQELERITEEKRQAEKVIAQADIATRELEEEKRLFAEEQQRERQKIAEDIAEAARNKAESQRLLHSAQTVTRANNDAAAAVSTLETPKATPNTNRFLKW